MPGFEWRALGPEEYSCNFEDYSVSFLLKPGDASLLATVYGYRENPGFTHQDSLQFRALTLEGNKGRIVYEEREVAEAFHTGKVSASRYVLRYE